MTDIVEDAPARLLRQDVPEFAGHTALHGPLPGLTGRQVIAAVEQSGLTGRGGAAFPTGRKLATVAHAAGRRGSVVVANGCEGEPASGKDKALMLAAPHLVLDGLELAARAVGARQAHLCIHQDAHDIRDVLTAALTQRPAGITPITLAAVPHRYVASEATALVRALNGGPSLPAYTPPHPFERGVAARPTLVDNVETLAHLALISRYGPEWFRAEGTADAAGTALVTVTGAVRAPGVYEIPLGLPGSELVRRAGGAAEPVQAVLCGGYGGIWLGITEFEAARLSPPGLAATRSTFGAGVFVALPARACALAETARIADYLAAQSAGQCGPCWRGLPALAQALHELLGGGGTRSARTLETLLPYVEQRGACAHPTGAARMIGSALSVFSTEVRAHASRGTCPAAARPSTEPRRGRRYGS